MVRETHIRTLTHIQTSKIHERERENSILVHTLMHTHTCTCTQGHTLLYYLSHSDYTHRRMVRETHITILTHIQTSEIHRQNCVHIHTHSHTLTQREREREREK